MKDIIIWCEIKEGKERDKKINVNDINVFMSYVLDIWVYI